MVLTKELKSAIKQLNKYKMKKLFLLLIMALTIMSCQPCENSCKFKEGDEVTIKAKSKLNNDGVIHDVYHHNDCSCYYSVQHSGMLNITTNWNYEEYELK